jgi:hypothetical protein
MGFPEAGSGPMIVPSGLVMVVPAVITAPLTSTGGVAGDTSAFKPSARPTTTTPELFEFQTVAMLAPA